MLAGRARPGEQDGDVGPGAGDAKGETIPSGFARVEGFLTGSARSCTTRYR
ncbi:hypothetical protein [Umezawaea sp.]|uniref:hypothetical protein n=1 Tax=Umezawaea sp. TaxID=1955258 RepID=UPI002ED11DE9